MNVLLFLFTLAVAQAVLANRFSTSDDDDSIAGTNGINFVKKAYSSAFKTKSLQSSSSAKAELQPPHPPTVKLPSHPEVFANPHPEIVRVPHPPEFIADHVVPKVHLIGDDRHHLDVLQLSNGLQAVPLDDSHGRVSDYLYLGSEINLVPAEGTLFIPATDLIDGHTSFVNLGTESGHLSLSEITIGNNIIQGFEGLDDIGPVFIPVKMRSQRLVVNPVVYRTNRLSFYKSSPSSQFSSTSSVDHSPFHNIIF